MYFNPYKLKLKKDKLFNVYNASIVVVSFIEQIYFSIAMLQLENTHEGTINKLTCNESLLNFVKM